MKKVIMMIFIVLTIIVALFFAGNAALHSFNAFLMGKPDIIQEVVSPNGKYVAYVFEANAGATTRFTYRLSVLKNGKQPRPGDVGNTFIAYDEFDVAWVSDNTLKVNNTSSVYVFKQKIKIGEVNIIYKHPKE